MNKSAFVAAVQTDIDMDGKPRFMRLTPIIRFTKEALKDWASHSLAPTAHVVSDGLHCYRQAAQRPEFRWVNTMLGNLKTALSGTYRSFDRVKYGARYLAEFAYCFNRRFDLAAMVPRLLRAAVTTKPRTFRALRLS